MTIDELRIVLVLEGNLAAYRTIAIDSDIAATTRYLADLYARGVSLLHIFTFNMPDNGNLAIRVDIAEFDDVPHMILWGAHDLRRLHTVFNHHSILHTIPVHYLDE